MSRFVRSLLQSMSAVVVLTMFFGQPAMAAIPQSNLVVAQHDSGGWWQDRDGWNRDRWWDDDDTTNNDDSTNDQDTTNDQETTNDQDTTNEWSDNDRGQWSDLAAFAANNAGEGFWVLTKEGDVFALGGAPDLGTPKTSRRLVAMASHPTRAGFWVLDVRGRVHAFGAAKQLGSAKFKRAVGMAVHRSGRGYWIASANGKVAARGKAKAYGDLRRFDVAVDRIALREDADGYYLHTTSERWISFPNDWSQPKRDRDDRADRDRRREEPAKPQPPKVTRPRRTGGVRVVTVGGITVARAIADNLRRMLAKSRRAGVSLGGWGYRSTARQIELRRAHCGTSRYAIYKMPSSQCSPPTARPGYSMHEQGRAIDFYKKGRNGAAISIGGTREFRWLKNNARRYGFYNLPSEPWHWSTNGR